MNVITSMNELYDAAFEIALSYFRELFRERYIEMYRYLKRRKPDEDFLDELVNMYLASMLPVKSGAGTNISDREEPEQDRRKPGKQKPEKSETAQKPESILETPNPVVGYTFDTEALRKRDRAIEAILAAPTNIQKQVAYDKNLRYWMMQVGFFGDIVSDEAAYVAMVDANIKKVMWITQGDERVCIECHEKDKNIYPIKEVPDKPHPRCRCYLRPVK